MLLLLLFLLPMILLLKSRLNSSTRSFHIENWKRQTKVKNERIVLFCVVYVFCWQQKQPVYFRYWLKWNVKKRTKHVHVSAKWKKKKNNRVWKSVKSLEATLSNSKHNSYNIIIITSYFWEHFYQKKSILFYSVQSYVMFLEQFSVRAHVWSFETVLLSQIAISI